MAVVVAFLIIVVLECTVGVVAAVILPFQDALVRITLIGTEDSRESHVAILKMIDIFFLSSDRLYLVLLVVGMLGVNHRVSIDDSLLIITCVMRHRGTPEIDV